MTDLDTRRPEFAIALRGYDRAQVDEYVTRLQELLAAAEQRVRSAESEGSADRALAQTRDEHQVLMNELEQEREQVRVHVAELEHRRATLLHELRRIRDAAGVAAGIAPELVPTQPVEPEIPEEQATTEQVALSQAAA